MLKHAPSKIRLQAILVGAAAAVSVASLANAQNAPAIPAEMEEPKLKPPVPAPPRAESSDMLGMAFAVLLGAAVLGVNMIPGRRSHQD